MSAVACIDEGHADSEDEIREWMSGNLCRCSCYPNIVDAVGGRGEGGAAMRDLRLRARRTGAAEAVQLAARSADATFVAGGTDLLNLMKDGAEDHDHLIDINRLPLADGVEESAGRLRIGALARMSDVAVHPVVRERLPGAVAGAARRRLAAGPQHGLDRRQPAAAHALLVLPRRRDLACNKREPGQRLRRRSTGRTAGTRSSAAATTASPCTRPTWRSR